MQKKLIAVILAITSSSVLVVGLAAQSGAAGYPPTATLEDVRERIDEVPSDHPRLLVDQARLAALRAPGPKSPLFAALARGVVKQAAMLQEIDPVQRTLQGRRLLSQSRRCLKRVIITATAFHLTGDLRHARRCEKEMLAAARFEDWNPSHFLDVAEMTLALAIGYDWLFSELSQPSRNEIKRAILEKGVSLPFNSRHNRWVRSTNNWGQVCHGGLTAGALAILEDEPDLAAQTVHNALQNVTQSMAVYAPNGSYPEGPSYWSYGTSYNVLLIALLEGVLGSDFGLSQAPGFRETGGYLSLVTGPSGESFNYADGGSGRSPEPSLHWFASRYDRPDWLLGESRRLLAEISRFDTTRARGTASRFLPLALLWMEQTQGEHSISQPLHWNGQGPVPVTVHRSSWTDPDAIFVGLKGGSPSANHGQMDTGSFVLDAGGVRWAMDLGAEGYHGIESRGMNLWNRNQASDRWKIFRQSNLGHNTLVINGQPQQVSGHGEIVQFSDNPDFPHSIVDMSLVYRGQVQSARRGIALINEKTVLIQDQLSGLKPGSSVRWGMITPGSVGAVRDSTIELVQGAAQIKLVILSPQPSNWKILNTQDPRNEWDSPNPGTRMIAFEAHAPESGKLTLAVVAIPGGNGPPSLQLEIHPLDQWPQTQPPR